MEVKKINRNKIFEAVYKCAPLPKQSIAYALQMSLPPITQNIRELQEQGLVIETGAFESTGGRKAKRKEGLL